MSTESFRWRTVIEVAVISIVIYLFLGTSGLPNSLSDTKSLGDSNVPVARAKIESTKGLECARHDFDIHVFSTRPLIIYIDGFLSEKEAELLVDIMQASQATKLPVLTCNLVQSNGKSPPSSIKA